MYCYYCGYDPAPVAGQICSHCKRIQPAVEVCSLEIYHPEGRGSASLCAFREEETFKGQVVWESPPWIQRQPMRDPSHFRYRFETYFPRLEAMGFKIVKRIDNEFRYIIERNWGTEVSGTHRCSCCDQLYREEDTSVVDGSRVCHPCRPNLRFVRS